MNAGVFISEQGVTGLKEAFELKQLGKQADLQAPLFDRSASFDDFYLSLYLLHLSKQKTYSVALHSERTLVPKLRLELVSSMEIASAAGEQDFAKTLIDEFVVADVLNFRNAVLSSLPLPIKLEAFSLGCVYMRFAIYGSAGVKVEDNELPGISSGLLASSDHWTNLFKRYKVQDYQLRS